MNSITICLFNLFLLSGLLAPVDQGLNSKIPQKIVSIAQELHELDYYISQSDLWKIEIDKNQSNADAWLNYYRACRFVNMLGGGDNQHDLKEIYNQLVNHIEGTYEYHYLSFVNGGADKELFHHIEKAYELDPDRTDVYSLMINQAVTTQDIENMKVFNSKWMDSGEISQGVLSWNYNSLMSLGPNAILLTYGDNDTYPSWMLQQVQDVRTDVEIINVNLLMKKEYCDAIFAKCGIPIYDNLLDQDKVWGDDFIPLADHIIQHAVRPLYFSVTVPKSIRENYSNDLYTVGLSFKHSQVAFDNISILRDNYENKFLTDYMLVGFQDDKSVTVLNSLNMNYLPGFLTLIKEYIKNGEEQKRDKIGEIIGNIAQSGGKLQNVVAIIEATKMTKPLTETLLDIKTIDKKMKPVGNGLYAADTETINANYEQFLMDLLRNKEYDLLEKCKTVKTDWMSLMPDKFKYIDKASVYIHADPESSECPVQNISYDAAVVYCEWLTRAYNSYDKKKNFQEVVFRLPTEKEWEQAASMGKMVDYPWGGNEYRNAKGCYLSNFYSSDEPMCIDCDNRFPANDGAFFIVKADAYFPNDLGLYGMSGNVAEMVKEKGIAKGGSWEDVPTECKIQSVKKINGPSPAVGFRVFMEVKN